MDRNNFSVQGRPEKEVQTVFTNANKFFWVRLQTYAFENFLSLKKHSRTPFRKSWRKMWVKGKNRSQSEGVNLSHLD